MSAHTIHRKHGDILKKLLLYFFLLLVENVVVDILEIAVYFAQHCHCLWKGFSDPATHPPFSQILKWRNRWMAAEAGGLEGKRGDAG